MICIEHVISSVFGAESNGYIFRKLGSHRQGPGAHVDQGLGGVHHVGVCQQSSILACLSK